MVRAFLEKAGIDKDDFVFFDGSGLSGHDLVAPRATVTVVAVCDDAAVVCGLEGFAAGGRGGWVAGGAVCEGSACRACVCQDGDAGRGAGFEWVSGVCEWEDGDLFDHGGEPYAGDSCGSGCDG